MYYKWTFLNVPENLAHKRGSDINENEEETEEPIGSSFSTHKFSRNFNGTVKEDEDERESSVASSIRQRITASVERRAGSQCAAKCRNGQLCRATPTPGHLFCHRHLAHWRVYCTRSVCKRCTLPPSPRSRKIRPFCPFERFLLNLIVTFIINQCYKRRYPINYKMSKFRNIKDCNIRTTKSSLALNFNLYLTT